MDVSFRGMDAGLELMYVRQKFMEMLFVEYFARFDDPEGGFG